MNGFGGGAVVANGVSQDCDFEANTAAIGGGGAEVTGSLQRCLFRANHASFGGGVFIPNDTAPSVVACVFRDNTAARFGGGASGWYQNVAFESCQFLGNTAAEEGGGVYASGALRDCLLQGNHARWGGAVSQGRELTGCAFLENTADAAGGAAYSPAGSVAPVASGCVFYSNEAPSGGGLYAQSVGVTVDQCTFVADRAANGGSALALVPATTTMSITRSILAFSPLGVPVTYWTAPGVPPLEVQCTDVFGNAEGDWVGALAPLAGRHHNFAGDPLFCDRVTGDFTLADGSPCLPPGSPCGEQVGALGRGCGAVAVTPRSWGSIKALYR